MPRRRYRPRFRFTTYKACPGFFARRCASRRGRFYPFAEAMPRRGCFVGNIIVAAYGACICRVTVGFTGRGGHVRDVVMSQRGYRPRFSFAAKRTRSRFFARRCASRRSSFYPFAEAMPRRGCFVGDKAVATYGTCICRVTAGFTGRGGHVRDVIMSLREYRPRFRMRRIIRTYSRFNARFRASRRGSFYPCAEAMPRRGCFVGNIIVAAYGACVCRKTVVRTSRSRYNRGVIMP